MVVHRHVTTKVLNDGKAALVLNEDLLWCVGVDAILFSQTNSIADQDIVRLPKLIFLDLNFLPSRIGG